MLKTTEIVIEQLIIGLLFLALFSLFIFGSLWPASHMLSGEYAKFVLSVLVVIAAYASGIVIDRIADTLLDRFLKHARLQVGLGQFKMCQENALSADIFPEDRVRIEILEKGKEVSDYHDYLRTRMRITRAITCLLPPLFTVIMFIDYGVDEESRRLMGALTLLFYVYVLIHSNGTSISPPRTDDKKKIIKYIANHLVGQPCPNDSIKVKMQFNELWFSSPLLATLIYTILSFCMIIISEKRHQGNEWIMVYLLATYFGTVVVGWVWWRITHTFLAFLRDYEQYKNSQIDSQHRFDI